jgi:hypothetical protein
MTGRNGGSTFVLPDYLIDYMMIYGFRISKQLLTNAQKVVYVELGKHMKFLLVVVTGVDLVCDIRTTRNSG